ncbi:MAG: LamG domain-containing protein [Porphyromonadaceae bacterium]|nr:LamG domain-containing protein [Porphyromonadaceae bacterium]
MKKYLLLTFLLFGLSHASNSQSGYALSLPGGTGTASTSSLEIPALNSHINSFPFTVEMWVKPVSWVSYGGFWVDRSGNINSVQFDNNSAGYLRSDFNAIARFVSSLSNAVPNFGVWNHLSMSVRADSVIVGLNGVYYKTRHTTTWNNSFFSNVSYVGSDPATSGRNVAGQFDEVRFWNVARTPDEIENFKDKALNGNETGLVAYYNFDNQDANDKTLNAKNATANGASYVFVPSVGSDASLSNIELSAGVLDKDFSSGITTYTAIVPPSFPSTTATGIKTQSSATLTNSPAILSLSNPTVIMTNTSGDGTATKDYTINFAQPTVENWSGNGAVGNRSYPNLWGWSCSNSTSCWSLANSSGTACRYNDVSSGWTFNGANWSGRNLYIRWDGVGGTSVSSVYSYPVYLEACQSYALKLKYSWANNATVPNLTASIATDPNGVNKIISKDLLCSQTKQLFLEETIAFNSSSAGVCYLTLGANTAALCAIADFSLTKIITPDLSVSVSNLTFDDLNSNREFTISGNSLSESVILTAPSGISLSKYTFTTEEVQCGVTVSATFDGSRSINNEQITINSGTLFSKSIQINTISGDGSCFTPLYSDKVNLINDPFINNLSNFSGWGTTSLETASPYCGKNSGKITTSGSIDQALNLNPYTKYRMKAVVKTVGGTFQLGIAKYDGNSADINNVIDTGGEWQVVDFYFNTGAVTTGALTFFNNYQKSGTIGYIDNWELYEIAEINGMDVVISNEQIPENEVKATLREMLAKHLPYAEGQFKSGGYFGNGQSVEHGARTNADYALIYAFIYKKAQDQSLPGGMTIETIKQRALSAIRYSYDSHTANKVKLCTDNRYWGLVWESSMWSTSTAFAAWLMWDELTNHDKAMIRKMVVAEADYKLSTPIPTAINSDTKAEENGWDTNILAIASAMFPEEKNSEAWTYRCKQYAMNTYSVNADLYNYDVVDGKYVRDWHIGANLFPDYALENHNFFHTSYLNIPIQEMSESLLAYKAVQNQQNPVFEIPEALKHNVSGVWNSMLKEFIMADGILAMPNGNDWSMYIYDELGTYSALACIYRDPDALMLESLVLQYAKMRQSTTSDGSFLLSPDVGERRMAVTGRRLVFAHLYHDYFPTSGMTATKWSDFSKQHEITKYLPYSGIIRSNNDDRYVTFSWFQSADLSYKSYMGMASPNNANFSNIIFPLKVANTGNFTGYTDVSGRNRNASFQGNTFTMNPKNFSTTGKLNLNDSAISQYLSFYSTPGNAVIYVDELVGNTAGTLTKEGGLLLGITTDILTKLNRTLYYEGGNIRSNGNALEKLSGNWVNVDNEYGVIYNGNHEIAFGEKELKTSVYVSKLYGSYSTTSKAFAANELIGSRAMIAYPGVNSAATQHLEAKAQYPYVAAGWKAVAAEDPDGKRHLIISNFRSNSSSEVSLSFAEGAPVFDRVTNINNAAGTATFSCMPNSSITQELYAFVKSETLPVKAVQGENPYSVFILNENNSEVSVSVSIWINGAYHTINSVIEANQSKFYKAENNMIVEKIAELPFGYRNISRGKHIVADDQLPENFPFAMIDDEDTTFYKSMTNPTSASPQKLTLRLMGNYMMDKLIVKSVAGIGPKDIAIQTSMDGVNFTSITSSRSKILKMSKSSASMKVRVDFSGL